jgi:3-methyladenine DNA glycosylase AlkD
MRLVRGERKLAARSMTSRRDGLRGSLFAMSTERPARPFEERARTAIEWLEDAGDAATLANMGPRFGIHTDRAFGVPMARMKVLAKQLGTDHALAAALWASGWYEARMVASMVDEASLVSGEQMDAWCADFDNWAIVDTVCFNLFDRTADRWSKVDQWSTSEREFVKRAAFALLWSLALHDRAAGDDRFVDGLALIERDAGDGRPLVDKAIAMALRSIGKRRPSLTGAAIAVAERLASSAEPAARRIGRPALKELRR